MKHLSIKTVVATAIGAALFVVIGLLINIPTPIPNTSIQLQYAVQSLFSLLFGPLSGFLIGFIGHAFKDAVTYGLWWTWIIPSGLFGLVIGLLKNRFKIEQGIFTNKDAIVFNVVQIITNIVVWGIVAPVGDIVVYSQSVEKVFTQGVVVGLVNAFTVGIGGTILLAVYAKTRTQESSLSRD